LFSWISDPQAWITLFTLTTLEIVLGIDNLIFLTILVGKLPPQERQLARFLGLAFAMLTRILLLLSLVWIMRLTTPLFTLFSKGFSGRDLILLFGGLFLIVKSLYEMHQMATNPGSHAPPASSPKKSHFFSIIIQIGIVDIIFSLDSVITAVGLANHLFIMIFAIVLAMIVMMLSAKTLGDFVDKHPTIKMLALSFLVLVGFTLMAEGMNFHIPKSYIYFAMAYSAIVECLNLRVRSHT